jgi:hypothetical protein
LKDGGGLRACSLSAVNFIGVILLHLQPALKSESKRVDGMGQETITSALLPSLSHFDGYFGSSQLRD